ncbi:MAG: DedA family protein [Armatimonadota bacterium]
MVDSILKPIAEWVISVISSMGYPGIVLLMAIESACIPLPSEIIMPFSGYLVYTGRFDLHAASIAGALGCAVGSAAAYWVGIWGGRPFLERYGRYVLIRRKDLDAADRFFERWGMWAVFIARLLPIIRTFISLPAGISRMPFIPFLALSFVGSVPWCYLLAYVGKVLGENWQSIRNYFHGADMVVGIALAAGFALWLWHHLKPEPVETETGK